MALHGVGTPFFAGFPQIPHHHFVFSIPKILRRYFQYDNVFCGNRISTTDDTAMATPNTPGMNTSTLKGISSHNAFSKKGVPEGYV
jgi:hypothetical protein